MDNNNDKYIGEMLDGRYEIIELIGSGGMANVYKAMCNRLNRYVAVKIMRDETASNEDFRKRFRAESQAVAMLSHPNIVSVYDVSHSDDVEYIVMEMVDGITLKQYMHKVGALHTDEVVDFTTQIAKALSHAHDKGIIHRDIKPQNIMLLKDGMIKVADFGIAALATDMDDRRNEAVGSVHYIAPEQARGGSADTRSDIYSLGIVLYEMLTGKLPYNGESDVEVAVKHMNSVAEPPRSINASIPVELERICLKAMATDIRDRYQSADELLSDLDDYRKQCLTAQVLDDSVDSVLIEDITEEQPAKGNKKAKRVSFFTGLIGVLLVIALACFGIYRYFLKDIIGSPQYVSVPSFVGRHYEDIINDPDLIKTYKFTVIFKIDLENNYGIIIDQTPESGSDMPVGTNGRVDVEITVSSGEALPDENGESLIPDLVNKDKNTAIIEVQNAGFEYAIEEASSDSVTRGFVIETEPTAGSSLTNGGTVKLIISAGPEIEITTVPQLKGLSKDAAIAKIEASKLSLGSVSTVDSELEAGTVVWQSIDAGESVEARTKVFLNVSSGPKSGK